MNAVGVKLGNGWYSHEQHGEASYGKQNFSFFFLFHTNCFIIIMNLRSTSSRFHLDYLVSNW